MEQLGNYNRFRRFVRIPSPFPYSGEIYVKNNLPLFSISGRLLLSFGCKILSVSDSKFAFLFGLVSVKGSSPLNPDQ
jgi:hypothetical protein